MKNSIDNKNTILNAFEIYKDVVFSADTDLKFWNIFMNLSINNYQENGSVIGDLFSAGYAVYDSCADKNEGYLKMHGQIREYSSQYLADYFDDFFSWISSLTILKNYNAMENFLLQAIQLKYFPANGSLLANRKAINEMSIEIKKSLSEIGIKVDTQNNRHILKFLKLKSTEIELFLDKTLRIDLNTKWSDFFELISILRNIVAHQGTIVSADNYNNIKSIGKDIFDRHFYLKADSNDYMNFHPYRDLFSGFTSLFNEFVINVVKFMFEEEDLSFLKMY